MLTRAVLEESFKVYFDEIERCVRGRCYWALLHLVVVLPDICASLESDNGETNDSRYRNWCKRYLADQLIKPGDWYRMRCIVLHQGRTVDEEGKSQYAVFSFSQPNEAGLAVHPCVKEGKQGKILHMDVGVMADLVRAAMHKWFEFLEKNEQPEKVQNVVRNAEMLARSQDRPVMPTAMQRFTIQNYTTSSPH